MAKVALRANNNWPKDFRSGNWALGRMSARTRYSSPVSQLKLPTQGLDCVEIYTEAYLVDTSGFMEARTLKRFSAAPTHSQSAALIRGPQVWPDIIKIICVCASADLVPTSKSQVWV